MLIRSCFNVVCMNYEGSCLFRLP